MARRSRFTAAANSGGGGQASSGSQAPRPLSGSCACGSPESRRTRAKRRLSVKATSRPPSSSSSSLANLGGQALSSTEKLL